jgi:hypothetical protein
MPRNDFPISRSFLESGALTVGEFNGDGRPGVAVASTVEISVLLKMALVGSGSETVCLGRDIVLPCPIIPLSS